MSKLVSNGGKDTGLGLRFLELSRAEKVATQDSLLVGITLIELFRYGISNRGYTGPSLTGQPEDTRASQ